MTLSDAILNIPVTVEHVGGSRAFRLRLMELGLVPGTRVEVIGVAPLGDPLHLVVRGSNLSIRRAEAKQIRIAETAACETTEFAGELVARASHAR